MSYMDRDENGDSLDGLNAAKGFFYIPVFMVCLIVIMLECFGVINLI
jgi:hypothetical protein